MSQVAAAVPLVGSIAPAIGKLGALKLGKMALGGLAGGLSGSDSGAPMGGGMPIPQPPQAPPVDLSGLGDYLNPKGKKNVPGMLGQGIGGSFMGY